MIGLKRIAVTSLSDYTYAIISRSVLLENEGDLKVKGACKKSHFSQIGKGRNMEKRAFLNLI